jgi:GT2 family glycosyltransferase
MIKLSIVFLNYNRRAETQFTSDYLHQLLAERDDVEVIAVDNASSDDTWAYLSQQHWMKTLQSPENTGIAGYNLGFAQAQGHYILVLDDDSHPKDLATLEQLIHRLDNNPQLGVIACKIEDKHGHNLCTWHMPDSNQPHPSMAFVGCGFVIRRDLFQRLGWYPADFFLYQNELDVAFQVRQLGYQILYDPHCVVVHRNESVNSRPNWRRIFYATRNTIWLIRRYFPQPHAFYLIISRLIIGLGRAVYCGELRWYFKAVMEAFAKPIQPQLLSPALRKEMDKFWKQNSLWHQLTRQL